MNRIAVITNLLRDVDGNGAKTIIQHLKNHNITPVMDISMQEFGFDCEYSDINNCLDIDMAIIIGGDGTLLSETNRYINTDVPVLGINYGSVGFLTELEKDEVDILDDILNGNYKTEKRAVIAVLYQDKVYYSINEATVHRGNSPKMLDTEIIIDNVSMNKFRADGLIVSTSSGSTAYSLSAGGPIIHPLIDAFVITPICPKNLYLRSVVVPASNEIVIGITDTERCAFSIDGKLIDELDGNHSIKISKGGYLNTVKRDGSSFYKIIKKKIFEKEI